MPGLSRPFDYDMTFLLLEPTAVDSEWSLDPDRATPAGYHTRPV